MAGRAAFIFGIHNHQPVGNFDHVIEEAYQKSYLPFLKAMAAHPRIKFCVHTSGCLWDWMLAHRAEWVEVLKPLVARGQVEMLTGAYQEPIFPVIPDRDLEGQVRKLTDFLHKTFGVVPTGAWLTERVWEPHLPAVLKRAGIGYTLVDDWHLKGAGVAPADLHGAFVTDHLGATVRILPIDERLRYLVPFREPEETLAHLKGLAETAPPGGFPAGVLVDDGEKFGVWPETHTWVFVRGWLDRFLAALDGAGDWLEFLTPSEYLDRVRPVGPVYMGTASYSEMMEWALPPAGQRAMGTAHGALKAAGALEAAAPYLKGGTWRGFQAKYPEANWLHKKMLRVSEKVAAAEQRGPGDARVAAAREALWRGQCNCPYWHGVFGGLYLNNVRYAVWHNLIEAERLADEILHGTAPWIEITEPDADADGEKELVVESDALSVLLRPAEGGSASSWEVRAKGWNILDTLGRREEAYHAKLAEAVRTGTAAAPAEAALSIHDLVRVKEPGLERYLAYDQGRRRGALQDRLLAPEATLAGVRDGSAAAAATLWATRAEAVIGIKGRTGSVVFTGRAEWPEGGCDVFKQVGFMAGSRRVTIGYELEAEGPAPRRALLAVEWNIGLLAGDAPDRYLLADGKKPDDPRACAEGECTATVIEAVDGWQRLAVRFEFAAPTRVWRYPVWTVSQSEGGFERTYQSTVLLFLHPVDLAADGTDSFSFTHDVLDLP